MRRAARLRGPVLASIHSANQCPFRANGPAFVLANELDIQKVCRDV